MFLRRDWNVLRVRAAYPNQLDYEGDTVEKHGFHDGAVFLRTYRPEPRTHQGPE